MMRSRWHWKIILISPLPATISTSRTLTFYVPKLGRHFAVLTPALSRVLLEAVLVGSVTPARVRALVVRAAERAAPAPAVPVSSPQPAVSDPPFHLTIQFLPARFSGITITAF